MKSPFLFVGFFLAMMLSGAHYLTRPLYCGMEAVEIAENERMLHMAMLDEVVSLDNTPLPTNLEIPLYPGCERVRPYPRRLRCSFDKLGQFFSEELEIERFEGQRGLVLLRFHVPLDGKLSHVRLDEDTNAHLAAELVRLFGVMQGRDTRWNPGRQNGKPVPMDMVFKFCFDCNGQASGEYTFDLIPVLE
ncbi:MAG: hypothetical protein AAFZ52_06005 [Bacteroidota bacterium]